MPDLSFDHDPAPAALVSARAALRMDAADGLLLDGVSLTTIAVELGTPCWVYGAPTLRARYRALAAALAPTGAHIHYAVKANDHLAVLSVLAREGAGADVVSGGELARAIAAGIDPGRIVFSGVGKTAGELRRALAAGIAQINVESAEELPMVAAAARAVGRVARIALRMNPDVDAGTHHKISTGKVGDKFGIEASAIPALYRQASNDTHLQPVGIALHIGSQIAAMRPYRAAYAAAAGLVRALRAAGLSVERVDCGGGLAIAYRDEPGASIDAYAGVLQAAFAGLDLELMVEPGRWLAGPAGVLLAGVVLVKRALLAGGAPGRFVVLDAAMNDLLRPSMYQAWHGIVPLAARRMHGPVSAAEVVGPVCESSDVFAHGRLLPELVEGDRVALLDTGAYGAVMSSTYNSRPLAPQVMVDEGSWSVIRPRQAIEAMWAGERIPAHLAASHDRQIA